MFDYKPVIARYYEVVYFSPGTMVAERTVKVIETLDVKHALRIAKTDIVERHNARPYGFQFQTWETMAPVPDGEGGFFSVKPRLVKQSGLFYIQGVRRTLEEMEQEEPEAIITQNMRSNRWDAIVETIAGGYLWSQPLGETDAIIDARGEITWHGSKYEAP